MSNNNIEFGIVFKADGTGLVSTVNISKDSLEKLGSSGKDAGEHIAAGANKGREGIAAVLPVTNASDASLKRFGASGKEAGEQIYQGINKGREGIAAITPQMDALSTSIQRVGLMGGAYFGISALASYAESVVHIADQYTGLQSRLKLATNSQQEFNIANQALFAIAQANGAPLAETVSLYNKLSPAMRELGQTQQQTLKMADLVAKSLRISGASASESSSAMLQFSQAMGSGVLRGDEFNSLMENSPRLMKALADGMNKPVGALRGLAEQGKLSAEEVSKALLSQSSTLTAEVGKMPLTVSAAMTKMHNSVMQEIGSLNSASGSTSMLAGAIDGLSNSAHGLVSAIIGVSVAAGGYAALRLGNTAMEAVSGIQGKKAALLEERAATLAAADAEVTRTAAVLSGVRANSAIMGSTASLTAATNAHTASLTAQAAAQTAGNSSMGIASSGMALLGGPIGAITLALGVGAAAWSLWGNQAEDSAKRAIKAVADAEAYAMDHGLDGKTHLQSQLAKAKDEEAILNRSAHASGSSLLGKDDYDRAAAKRTEIKELEERIKTLDEREKNLANKPVDHTAWDKLHQTTAQKHAEALEELNKAYLKEINVQNMSQEQMLKLAADYETKKSILMAKGEKKPKALHAQADPVQSDIERMQMEGVKAQLQAAGMSAASAADQVKVYESALKGLHAVEKLRAEGHMVDAVKLQAKNDTELVAMQLATESTIKHREELLAQTALTKANEDAAKFIDKMNQSAALALENQAFANELDGKSVIETARLTAERKAYLEVNQQIYELNMKYKDNPAAADAGIKNILDNAPAQQQAAGNTAAAGAAKKLIDQVDQAGGGAENDRYKQQLDAQNAYFAAGKTNAADHASAIERIEQEHQNKLIALVKSGHLSAAQMDALSADTKSKLLLGNMASILSATSSHNKEAFELNKKFSIGKAIVDTASAVMEHSKLPFPLNLGQVAADIALGASQISVIQSASFGGGGGGGGSSGGAPSAPSSNSNVPFYQPSASTPSTPGQTNATNNTAHINITVQTLDPNSVSDATRQKLAESLAGPLQNAFNRNAQQTVVMV